MTLGGRWGSIYSPHLNKSCWGAFHQDKFGEATRQVRWISLEASVNPLEAGIITDKSGGTTRQV
jgi:hypothetical protein